MKLKLSRRELILLSSLGIVLFLVVYYKFLIAPQIAKASELTIAREQKRNELAAFREDVSSQNKLDIELIELKSKVNDDSKNYFLSLDQEEIILIINEFTKDLNIKLKAVSFEEPKEETLGEDKENEEDDSSQQTQESTDEEDKKRENESKDEEIESEEEKSDLLDVYNVNLEYESDYYSLLDFLKNITQYQKKIMIKDITVNKDDEGKLTGNITLDFYAIGRIIDSEELKYAWQPDGQPTIGNPFSEFNGFYSVKNDKKSEENSSNSSAKSPIASASNTENNNANTNNKQNIVNKSGSKESSSNATKDNNIGGSINRKSSVVKPENTVNNGTGNSSNTGSSPSSGSTTKPSTGGSTGGNTVKPGTGNSGSGNNNGGNANNGNNGNGNSEEDKKPISLNKTLVNFESLQNMFFIGNNKDIIGNLQLNKAQKVEGNSSLSLKYDFVEKRKHNMANISFNNQAIIQEQPEKITLSVNPVDKSSGTVGIIIRDREGYEHKLKMTDNLNWNGWQTVSVDLPIDINYPAVIERLYVETFDFYEKLTGEILVDDLKLIYDK